MKLNNALDKRALMYSAALTWLDSPMPGVARRMLEREGGEMASRATTLVRYEAGSSFSAHSHDLGEEFMVLEGVFSDESGDYGEGMYVRNPPGSSHRPFTRKGCEIFVKLRQFSPDDSNVVRVDTQTSAWLPTAIEGQWVMPLYRRDGSDPEYVSLLKWSPGVQLKGHDHQGGEEVFVLKGSFGDEQGLYPQGTWLRNPAGSSHQPYSPNGCVLYIKTGHLPQQRQEL
ncbi:MAG: cupin domain-containing protein [Gammaproteobacteria bacterium]|nr:cupin domain-containing protein [Gammaproteobacteria bacterium]MBQ0840705.1 cupin domain-containing protein [Gammaproteobacteria bacterium]